MGYCEISSVILSKKTTFGDNFHLHNFIRLTNYNPDLFRNMFILSSSDFRQKGWQAIDIDSFTLQFHPDLNYSHSYNSLIQLHLLGDIFDYKKPQSSNQSLLDSLLNSSSIEDIFQQTIDFTGQYILIIKLGNELLLLNDACAQSEIYYDANFTTFASQVKLLTEVIEEIQHTDKDAIDFYSSAIFKKKKHFVGNSTHLKNVFHLLSNHYLDLKKKQVIRFFPTTSLNYQSTDVVAKEAAHILKAYLNAMDHRYPLAQAVTGGYDSRVLFLASLDTDAKYFVAQHEYMTAEHYDIWVPKNLTQLKNKAFTVFEDKKEEMVKFTDDYYKSVDFSRNLKLIKHYENHLFVNGNLSEIARNTNGYSKQGFTGEDFSFLYGSEAHPYPAKLYNKYIDENKSLFNNLGLDMIDMIHWEEQMSNWAAKSKSETKAEGRKVYSPFNSRRLLYLLLGTKRTHRDSHHNTLYDRIIYHLADGDSTVTKLPINPSFKQNIIRLLKTIKVYNIYRKIGVKTRKIKV